MNSTSASTIVVIGAGIAGASAAYSLAAKFSNVRLIELEPQPGLHATGRSAAILSETSGLWEVCALAVASRSFLTTPPDDFTNRNLLSKRGLLWVGKQRQSQARDALVAAAQRVAVEFEELDAEAACGLVPVLRNDWVGTAFYEPNAMSIDVASLLNNYVGGFRARGGIVSTSTPALALSRTTSGWKIDTGTSTVHCDVVVNAAGAWADDVAVRAGIRPLGLQPYLRTAFTFPVDAASEWPLVMDVDGHFYFEPEPPGVLASPSEETPIDACDAQPDEVSMARAVDALSESTTLVVRGVRSRWAGLRTFAPDRLPVVGPDSSATDFFWLAGQGGAGIKTAPALASATASLIDGSGWPPELDRLGVPEAALSPSRFGQ